MSCAKMSELITMQFGVLSQVCPRNMYYMGVWREWALLGWLADWKAL